MIERQTLFSGVQNSPDIFITQGFINGKRFIENGDSTVFIDLPNEMDPSSRNRQGLFQIKGKMDLL